MITGTPEPSRPSLQVADVTVKFGGLLALDSVTVDVPTPYLVGLIGPNGAGKTTLINAITGVAKPSSGHVVIDGKDVTGKAPSQIAHMGVARTFQLPQAFGHFTVVETMMLGAHMMLEYPWFAGVLPFGWARREEARVLEKVEEVIDFLELERYRDKVVRTLPYGVQKLVDLGRALVPNPQVLLLDEPSTGLTREEKENMARFLLRLRYERHLAMLWIEHDLELITDLADRLVALSFGQVIAAGEPKEVMRTPEVVSAYVGAAS